MTTAEARLRKALTEVRLAPQYDAAIEKGVRAAVAAWPDEHPSKQLSVARKVAMQELASRLGWDIP